MEKLIKVLVCVCLCLAILNALTRAASIPYDLDLDEYSPEEIEEAMQIIDDVPTKRAMCGSGYTYQAIIRECVPSLGALRGRGRGRNGRRGRRGLSKWSWRRY
ncbi:uncharacterized protein LOC123531981 [Mercenaria mercenaria]|uniref:uncharacterized protein LOC123531981 n=1 Tax=Mercenaria mercenaria TaxID=6596 RepID=UPI001E1DCED9|nr:uncharacterized protein LOC123531981 [Mercenaria mercenaria]